MRVLDARYLASAEEPEGLPPPAFAEVAFLGRSNVGKSSLMNRIAGRKKLVRTSSTPGCTRTINLFRLELESEARGQEEPSRAILDLVDLPGFGYARRSKSERLRWGPLVEGFLERRAGLRAAALLVDARRGFEEEELALIPFLHDRGRTVLCVATKLDKLPASKQAPELKRMAEAVQQRVWGVSATTGAGVTPLWLAVLRAAALGSAER